MKLKNNQIVHRLEIMSKIDISLFPSLQQLFEVSSSSRV